MAGKQRNEGDMTVTTTKLRVGIIFGGRSGEHAVSLMSAKYVLSQLDLSRYEVIQIGITRAGDWWVGDGVLAALEAEDAGGLTPATILPDPTRPGLRKIMVAAESEMLAHFSDLDVVFPVLHGTYGEDGTLQGLLEMAGIAYVGAGVLGSSLAMDKGAFFDVMRAQGIPVVDTVVILRSELEQDMHAALERAQRVGEFPLFVKPANLGSSVGVSKVTSRSDLMEGLMEAAQYDRRVVVQRGHKVREIEIAVMGNDQPQASVCGEVIPGEEFYSYRAKYHDDRSVTQIPADIPPTLAERIHELAVQAYKAIDLAGLARVDFFLDTDNGEVLLNEINTIPGFTQISMFPQLWAASGVPGPQLVDRLIELALARQAERRATRTDFRLESS
jgi:D-alanine-D-alanine ligase